MYEDLYLHDRAINHREIVTQSSAAKQKTEKYGRPRAYGQPTYCTVTIFLPRPLHKNVFVLQVIGGHSLD